MKNRSIKITDIAVLLVFALFAFSALSLLLTGLNIYRGISDNATEDYSRRSAARYISMRVRQGDKAGTIYTESFDGLVSLCIREDIDGESYLTRIYCNEGFVRELFTREDTHCRVQDGEKVVEADALDFSLVGNHLSVIISQKGHTQRLELNLRSGGEPL